MNTNNGVKWRRFIVPKKVYQINDHVLHRFYTMHIGKGITQTNSSMVDSSLQNLGLVLSRTLK